MPQLTEYFTPAKARPAMNLIVDTLLDRNKFPFLDEITKGMPFEPTSQRASSKSTFYGPTKTKTYYALKHDASNEHFAFTIKLATYRWSPQDQKFTICFIGRDNAVSTLLPNLGWCFMFENVERAYDCSVPFTDFVKNTLLPDFLATYDRDMWSYSYYKDKIEKLTRATDKYRQLP